MIYKKHRAHTSAPGGFFRLEQEHTKIQMHGFGFGEHIRLRDEQGNVWRGTAERASDNSVMYTFRNSKGQIITGIADGVGIVLRDSKGKTWRGFID